MTSAHTLQEFALADVLDYERAAVQWENDLEVMQFTGLKDKNGKEIYEGDVVCSEYDAHKLCRLHQHDLVEWSSEDNHFTNLGSQHNASSWLVVIGNIYENPELLTSKESGQP